MVRLRFQFNVPGSKFNVELGTLNLEQLAQRALTLNRLTGIKNESYLDDLDRSISRAK